MPTNAARLQRWTFQPIASVPTNLVGGIGHSQSCYDTMVAVDPVAADVIWMYGAAMQAEPRAAWNAALFRGQVTAGATTGTWNFGFLPANDDAAPAADPRWVAAAPTPTCTRSSSPGRPPPRPRGSAATAGTSRPR